uniref:peroxidase n=1 Tax=Brassica oleracea var. oleracea TaxID=109376 RepID=A0A0D3AI99_BRAOL
IVPSRSKVDQFLTTSYYSKACPLAESIVQATMKASFRLHPRIAPAMLKLLFSDCFVQGYDASVLISGPNTERTAEANLNLRGFDVIEVIKSQIESVCPGVVSCADILALAAREAVVLTKGPYWEVKLGRRDGNVSLAANVKSLPSQTDSLTEMLRIFANYGLNTEDFVALIGQ